MKTYSAMITETYKNLFKDFQKSPYAEKVWDMIQKAYAQMGGIRGSGFGNIHDMIQNIPMWKLVVRDNEVKAVIMYKDKMGRKAVALATDGTTEGKKELSKMLQNELQRSFVEVSGPAKAFISKHISDWEKYVLPVETVKTILVGKDIEPVDKFQYTRIIGGKKTKKILLGTPGKKIY